MNGEKMGKTSFSGQNNVQNVPKHDGKTRILSKFRAKTCILIRITQLHWQIFVSGHILYLATFGQIWQRLTTSGNVQQRPTTSDNVQQDPATSGNVRQRPATSSNVWNQITTANIVSRTKLAYKSGPYAPASCHTPNYRW